MTIDFAGTVNDSTITPDAPKIEIEIGRVGWFPDDDDHASVSEADLNGRTLVKVQLYRGAPPDDIAPDGEARGMQLRAQVLGPLYYIPPKGTEVLVAMPGGFQAAPGSSVILGTLGATPAIQYSKTRAKLDFGPDIDLVLKARSVTAVAYNDTDPDGAEDFIAVGPDSGIHLGDKDGLGVVMKDGEISAFVPDGGDAKSVLRLKKDMVEIVQKDGSNKLVKIELGSDTASIASGKFFATANTGLLGFKLTGGAILPIHTGPTPIPAIPAVGWAICQAP